MEFVGVIVLAIASVLATSYELKIHTIDISQTPFTVTLVGESNRQEFNLTSSIPTYFGNSSQNLTSDLGLGELHEIIFTAKDHDAWEFDAVWLDEQMLTLPADVFVLDNDTNVPCNPASLSTTSSSFLCGKILRLYLPTRSKDEDAVYMGVEDLSALTIAVWVNSVVFCCCALIIFFAIIFWARRNKSGSVEMMLEMQNLRTSIHRDMVESQEVQTEGEKVKDVSGNSEKAPGGWGF